MIALVNALANQLGNKRTETLFSRNFENSDRKGKIKFLAEKLDLTAISLKLSPYDSKGNYKGKLLPISRHKIEPAYVICPTSFICGTVDCQPRCLIQSTRERDIPMVTLIKKHTA